jgi:hypothetical protein
MLCVAYAECHMKASFAECHCDECHYAECCGANDVLSILPVSMTKKIFHNITTNSLPTQLRLQQVIYGSVSMP